MANESVIYETLKKISYDNLQQFVADINRNFAIIQNSPLYKGIPGKGGDEGKPGTKGERGSRFFFVDINKFNEQFPGEIVNGSVITLDWLNIRLQSFEEKNKVLKALGTDTLVDTDIIVLTNSIMLQYVLIEDILKDTGIAFNEQSNLVSSIETKIEQYVKYYVDNHPSIVNIQNIFEHYVTYAKNYTSTNNTYITNAQTKSSVYVPYFAGVSDTQGIKLENHKYFGFADKEFPESNNGTIVFGSMKRYVRLIQQTLSTTQKETYTSDYAPGEGNIPSAIFLQDTDNAGLMFGRKMSSNLRRFGMIYKDKDDNLIIKSDMGNLETDFSSIILNRNFLKYNKEVWFNDNLNLAKDLLHTGNIKNKFYRSAEYIHDSAYYGPTSLQEGSQEELTRASELRKKIMEVGYWDFSDDKQNVGKGAEYRNLNEIIKLKYFVSNVLVTDETGNILKDYFIEKADISSADKQISDNNLNDLVWQGTAPENNAIITSNYIETLIKKINSVQHYTKANYWRKDQFARVIGSGADIPSLYLNKDLMVNNIAKFGPSDNVNKQYFIPDIDNKLLTLGSNESSSKLLIRTETLTLSKYNNADLVLTMDGSGNMLKTYFREKTSLVDKTISSISSDKSFNSDKKYLTSNYFQWLIEKVNDTNNNLKDNYWRKEEYSPSDSPKIPALWLINDLKCRYVTATGIKTTVDTTTLDSKNVNIGTNADSTKTTILSKSFVINYLTASTFVSTDSAKKLITEFVKETYSLPVTNGLENIELTIENPEKHIVTSEYLIWLNNRINNVIGGDGNGLLDLYWKKTDYTGYKIPNLDLSGTLNVKGNVTFGLSENPFIRTTQANNTIEIGNKKLETTDTLTILNSSNIRLRQTEFASKVLVTDENGNIRKDITMCTDVKSTENNDNLVPLNTDDTDKTSNAGVTKTKDWKKIITGQQWDWLHGFMNAVKKRFINTFNRKETIDQIYDHMPVGSIIMWSKASANAAGIDGIPKGWVVCDGSVIPNTQITTPNLVDKFIRGVSDINNANGNGGSNRFTITKNNLPNLDHTHGSSYQSSHTHSGYLSIDNSTRFTPGFDNPSGAPDTNYGPDLTFLRMLWGRNQYSQSEGDKSSDNKFYSTKQGGFVSVWSFVNALKTTISSSGGHSHTISSVNPGGNSTPITHVPEYYKLIFIMKFDTRIEGGTDFNIKYKLVD